MLGDSHEYDAAITPFDKPEIDELVLEYMRTFVGVNDFRHRRALARHLRETSNRALLRLFP